MSNIAAKYVGRFNYENDIENWVLETKNTWNVFSVFITHHSKIKELSDENNDPKLIQTNAHPWDSHDLDDGNRKLSDITQISHFKRNSIFFNISLNFSQWVNCSQTWGWR